MQSEGGGDHIDAAIDAAARSLTTGEPSAAMRAGVRQRISERPPVASAFPGPPKLGTSEGGRRKSGWWLVPAGAMVLIAAMFVGRALLGPLGEPDAGTLSGPPAHPTDVRLSIERATTQPVAVGPDKARPAPLLALAPTFEPPSIEELEPLIPPITIEPLETRPIVVETSSGVMPIEIEPLHIEPLRGD